MDKVRIASFLPLTPVAFEILLALADGEQHGYSIMREVERRSAGAVVAASRHALSRAGPAARKRADRRARRPPGTRARRRAPALLPADRQAASPSRAPRPNAWPSQLAAAREPQAAQGARMKRLARSDARAPRLSARVSRAVSAPRCVAISTHSHARATRPHATRSARLVLTGLAERWSALIRMRVLAQPSPSSLRPVGETLTCSGTRCDPTCSTPFAWPPRRRSSPRSPSSRWRSGIGANSAICRRRRRRADEAAALSRQRAARQRVERCAPSRGGRATRCRRRTSKTSSEMNQTLEGLEGYFSFVTPIRDDRRWSERDGHRRHGHAPALRSARTNSDHWAAALRRRRDAFEVLLSHGFWQRRFGGDPNDRRIARCRSRRLHGHDRRGDAARLHLPLRIDARALGIHARDDDRPVGADGDSRDRSPRSTGC